MVQTDPYYLAKYGAYRSDGLRLGYLSQYDVDHGQVPPGATVRPLNAATRYAVVNALNPPDTGQVASASSVGIVGGLAMVGFVALVAWAGWRAFREA